MANSNLLDLNVNTLFEQYSIAEIDQVQKKVQMEVEKKREDLRTMVGERYRDLLKAADTIAVMKGTSASIITQVKNITTNCKSLHEKQLIGFKTDVHTNQQSNRQLNSYFGTVVQIKLLTTMPEKIWSKLDIENFSVATQLFIFARHISTGLQLDVNSNLMQYFPVAKKHWEILKPFFFTIKQLCLSVLERDELSPKLATDCLLSLFLLEKTTLDKLFSSFVQLRTKAFLAALASDQSAQRRVKDRILSSLAVLNSTVELLDACFLGTDSGEGLLITELDKLSAPTCPPSISLMELDDSDLTYTLPDIIAKFKPSFEVVPLSQSNVKTTMENWCKSISNVAKSQLLGLFELVSSMKTIQDIRKESCALKKSSSWSKICANLSLPPNLDFYENEYQPLINARIRDIIQQSWIKCVKEACDEVKQLLIEWNRHGYQDDINIWKENPADIPISLKQALSQDKKTNVLLMKTKGFNSDIVKICSAFDTRLETIFSEVKVFLEDDGGNVQEKQALIEYLKDKSQEQTSNFISRIKTLSREQKSKNFIFLSRLFIAFTELCPNFKTCLSYSYSSTSWDKFSVDKKSLEKWDQACNLLEDESFTFWKMFCDDFLEKFCVAENLKKDLGYEVILEDFVNWETITIEEKDEQDNSIQSTIRIPSQPRISLQQYLFNITQSLNNFIPQTLPRKILLYLTSKLTKDILNHYTILKEEKFVSSNQNIALQLYFDLKIIQILFVARDDKKILDEFQKLTSGLKNFVDPFDFELFYSYMNTNIKKCTQRIQYKLGVILPFPENIVISGEIKQTTGLDRDPNVLCLCSNGSSSTWFPLLPIVTPENKTNPSTLLQDVERTQSTKSKKDSKPSSSQPIVQNYASNVKSGAAAFFGAMSQDWFR